MFDFAGSEIVLIGIVALVLIGPKDLPVAVKGISSVIKKMRRMAGEFQSHVDEMVREADLTEVRNTLSDLRGLNVKSALRNAVDPDNSLHGAFADPFRTHPVKPVTTGADETGTAAAGAGLPEQSVAERPVPSQGHALPAFIPPHATAPAPIQPEAQRPPAFIPPRAGAPAGAAQSGSLLDQIRSRAAQGAAQTEARGPAQEVARASAASLPLAGAAPAAAATPVPAAAPSAAPPTEAAG